MRFFLLNKLKKIPFLLSAVRLFRKLSGISVAEKDLKRAKIMAQEKIRQYMANVVSPRLHIGCQHHPIEGWLNVDIQPGDPGVVFMDATKPFALPDGQFHYVFSEHMIEHIGLEDGVHMLRECYRIMKRGGRIRIVTPDVNLLSSLLQDPTQTDHSEYIEFSRRYFKEPSVFNEVVVVNNFFRDWGHQFIYSERTLESILAMAGFKDITRCQVGVSTDPVLHGLENHHHEITERFNRMESLVMEAVK